MNDLKMKFAKRFTMVVVLLSTVFCFGYAQSTNKNYSGISRLIKVKPHKQPKAPTRIFIEYRYTGNGFIFLPSVLFKFLEVTAIGSETGEVYGGVVSEMSEYYMETGTLSVDTYSITAFTETGDEYYGELIVTE